MELLASAYPSTTSSKSYTSFIDDVALYQPQARTRDSNTDPHSVEVDFIVWLKARATAHLKPVSLDHLVDVIARRFQIDPGAIASKSRGPLLSLARALTAWYSVLYHVATLAEVARSFHRGRSSLYETTENYRRLFPELFEMPLSEILDDYPAARSDVLGSVVGVGVADRYCSKA